MTMTTIVFKTSVIFYYITWHHIAEENSLHSQRLGNPESCSLVIVRIEGRRCVRAQTERCWHIVSSRDWGEYPRERIVTLAHKAASEGMNRDRGWMFARAENTMKGQLYLCRWQWWYGVEDKMQPEQFSRCKYVANIVTAFSLFGIMAWN